MIGDRIREELRRPLAGERRFVTRREGPFTHRLNPVLIAEARAAILLRNQLQWIDDIHSAHRRHVNEGILS